MAYIVSTDNFVNVEVDQTAHTVNVELHGSWTQTNPNFEGAHRHLEYNSTLTGLQGFELPGFICPDRNGFYYQNFYFPADEDFTWRAQVNFYFFDAGCVNEVFTAAVFGSYKVDRSWSVNPNADAPILSNIQPTSADVNFPRFSVSTLRSKGTVVVEYRKLGDAAWIQAGAPLIDLDGYGNFSIARTMIGLSPDTIYEYRLALTRNTSNFPFVTTAYYQFTSGPAAPVITTDPPTEVGSTSARLNGTVDANFNVVNYYFEYGLTTGYGSQTGMLGPLSGGSPVAVNAILQMLPLGPATYHYRLVLTYSGGTIVGIDRTFTLAANRIAGSIWIEGATFHYAGLSDVERFFTGTLVGASAGKVGSIWIEGPDLHYIDEAGNERFIAGTDGGAVAAKVGCIWVDSSVYTDKLGWIDEAQHKRTATGVDILPP